MKKWALHFLIFMLNTQNIADAQVFDILFIGPRSSALGHASVALPGAEALFHNQAGLVAVKNLSFIISCESRFLIKELSLMATGMVIPSNSGTFGCSFTRFGTGEYRNNHLRLAYAKELGEFVSAAVAFDYLSEKYPENSHPFPAVTIETGFIACFPGKWKAGLHLFNPIMAKIDQPAGKKRIPWLARTGIVWHIAPYLMLCSEMDFAGENPPSLHTGLEFNPFPEVSIRTGVSGNPTELSFGAGFKMGKLDFNISFICHGYLGVTPVAGVILLP